MQYAERAVAPISIRLQLSQSRFWVTPQHDQLSHSLSHSIPIHIWTLPAWRQSLSRGGGATATQSEGPSRPPQPRSHPSLHMPFLRGQEVPLTTSRQLPAATPVERLIRVGYTYAYLDRMDGPDGLDPRSFSCIQWHGGI